MTIHSKKNDTETSQFLHEFKKQASCFLKEKINSARLALTDVTPIQLLTEDVTNENSWPPDTRAIGVISRAAFEVDDYCRVVEILHNRLTSFDRKNWRRPYKALILLEHLLTHGPLRVAEEFKDDIDAIAEMGCFQYIDEKGFNWGSSVGKLSERVLKLIEDSMFLKEERANARKLTRGIEGFGSFVQRPSSDDGDFKYFSPKVYERSNSQFSTHRDADRFFAEDKTLKLQSNREKIYSQIVKEELSGSWFCDNEHQITKSLLVD